MFSQLFAKPILIQPAWTVKPRSLLLQGPFEAPSSIPIVTVTRLLQILSDQAATFNGDQTVTFYPRDLLGVVHDWLTLWGFQAFRPLTETNLLWWPLRIFLRKLFSETWGGFYGAHEGEAKDRTVKADAKCNKGLDFMAPTERLWGSFLHTLLNIQLNSTLTVFRACV